MNHFDNSSEYVYHCITAEENNGFFLNIKIQSYLYIYKYIQITIDDTNFIIKLKSNSAIISHIAQENVKKT